MIAGLQYTFLISLFWFSIYWLLGGIFFAIVSFLKVIKLRKARFSCLFTLMSFGIAFGATYLGINAGEASISTCLNQSTGFIESISSIIGCGILSLSAAGAIGFVAVITIGFILLYISRAANQSWLDSDEGTEEKAELIFEVE